MYRVMFYFAVALLCLHVDGAWSRALAPESSQLSMTQAADKRLVLSAQDQELYALIFRKQEAGDMKTAKRAIEKLSDQRLMGHVLYQRYMHPSAYRSHYHELKAWLAAYGDHPGADKVYKLALKKAGNSDERKASLKKPKSLPVIAVNADPFDRLYAAPAERIQSISGYNASFQSKVLRALRQGQKDRAVDWIYEHDRKRDIPSAQLDYLKAKLASAYLYEGRKTIAYELAQQAFKRSGSQVPMSGWVCGLVSWMEGYYDWSARYFQSAAISPKLSQSMRTASAFWAARSYVVLGKKYQAKTWFEAAAESPRSFYGLMAMRALGQEPQFDWSKPVFTAATHKEFSKYPRLLRAMALLDVGQNVLAQEEFLGARLADVKLRRGLLALADRYHMPHLSLRLASVVKNEVGGYYDGALYPEFDSHVMQNFMASKRHQVDPVLVFAIARQESRFNQRAESRSGAMGLMQIMPATARHIASRYGMNYGRQSNLLDPSINLALGQRYIIELLENPYVDGDIAAMLLAYNGGPGNLRRWRERWADVSDPLLMIELFPLAETRNYAERVLAHYWMYRIKHGRDLRTIDAMGAGVSLDYAQSVSDLPFDTAQRAP